jgi:hypothetical protein
VKLYFNLILLISIHLTGISQTILINEDFNNGIPNNWTIINNDSLPISQNSAVSFVTNGFVLRDNPDNSNVGDSLLMASSWHEELGEADDYLILPQITLGSFGNYLYFEARSIDFSHPEGLEVLISLVGSEISDFMMVEPAYSNLIMSPYWTTYKISLDSLNLQNQTINIAFRHFGNDQYLLALDNIIIESENPTGMIENQYNELSFYPNPAKKSVVINNLEMPLKFWIYNNIGKVVSTGFVMDKIDLQDLDQGLYFLQIEGYNTKKLIIEE